jgi:hypothetical protein
MGWEVYQTLAVELVGQESAGLGTGIATTFIQVGSMVSPPVRLLCRCHRDVHRVVGYAGAVLAARYRAARPVMASSQLTPTPYHLFLDIRPVFQCPCIGYRRSVLASKGHCVAPTHTRRLSHTHDGVLNERFLTLREKLGPGAPLSPSPMRTTGEAGGVQESCLLAGDASERQGGERVREVRHTSCSFLCRALPRAHGTIRSSPLGEQRSYPDGTSERKGEK